MTGELLMTRWFLIAVVFFCLLLTGVPVSAQLTPEMLHDQEIAAKTPQSEAVHQLAIELSRARRTGNIARVKELESLLITTVPRLPGEDVPVVQSVEGEDRFAKTMSPMWGGDAKVYTGPIWGTAKRQLCIAADTLGGIYVAFNAKRDDSLSSVRVYKSTNGGTSWASLLGFYFPGYAIQSFDMCITDTTGGRFILGFAYAVFQDKSIDGGGSLMWASFLNDGTNFRSTTIQSKSSVLAFRNPSICTDGANYSGAYFFVASEYINPVTDVSRGLWVTRSTDWGKTWAAPDTSVRGYTEGTPVIAIDWSTSPDSLCMAFTRFLPPNREIRVGRSGKVFGNGWAITYPTSTKDEFAPSLALDPVRGNGIITYTRSTGAPTNSDAMCFRSTDLFKTFIRDSIATTTEFEGYASVSYTPWGSGYSWRTAYWSSEGNGMVYYKALVNTMTGFSTTRPVAVNQYTPTGFLMPVVGFDRDIRGNLYRGNVVYAGVGPQDVYFDATDLTLEDVQEEEVVPAQYALDQNYPNPFNPSTTIRYALPHAASVRLIVFNTLGQQVAELVNATQEPGYHNVQFNGASLSSGIYFYRLETGEFRETRKFVLMK
jgi:hypothetical protein